MKVVSFCMKGQKPFLYRIMLAILIFTTTNSVCGKFFKALCKVMLDILINFPTGIEDNRKNTNKSIFGFSTKYIVKFVSYVNLSPKFKNK